MSQLTPSQIATWNSEHPVGSKVWIVFEHEIKSPAEDLVSNGRFYCASSAGGFLVAEEYEGPVKLCVNILNHDPGLAESRIKELEAEREELHLSRVETVEILSKRVAELEQQLARENHAQKCAACNGGGCLYCHGHGFIENHLFTREQVLKAMTLILKHVTPSFIHEAQNKPEILEATFVRKRLNRILDEMKGKEV